MRKLVRSPLGRDPALLLKQEGAAMFSVDLRTREGDGHVVVVLGGELDVVDAAAVAGRAFRGLLQISAGACRQVRQAIAPRGMGGR